MADICGAAGRSSSGDLVQKKDANGITTCYDYDPLHRPTDVGNSAYSSANPCMRFRYDSTTGILGSKPTGVTVNYPLSRLAEAETDTCAWPVTQSTQLTDEWFSYSARGELTDLYESTPHSAGYYHVNTAYWENGALKQLSGLGLPTLNFGVEGEGRTNTVADAGTGVAPVLSTGYDVAGHVTGVTFGSGDMALFGFDKNTGRETSYSEQINATSSMTGTMTWNANGTLKTLAITDPFNATDQQTCNYSYDELGRSSGANCGTPWSQTFTFDAFGNINKSGSITFSASYNAATNRETLVGSLAPTYDANGNMTYDPSGGQHHYLWNAANQLASADSNAEQFTYDALGRMVEDNKNGVYSEFVYALGTKLAIMSGQTLSKGLVPLPGGTQVKYVSTGISSYRVADWLGSLRIASNPNRTYAWGLAFAPYGERYASKNSPAFTFTGQNEDNVSGLYDFLYREESNAQGRWISPDPAGLSAVNIANPQTWNRYTYVGNNPLSFTDQLGLFQGDALGNGDDGCYLTFSCTVFTDSLGMQISSQFAQQALHNGSGVICQSCFGQAEQIGADNSISAVAVDFFRKDCSGPVSGGLAGALGNCTTSFIGSGLIQVGMLADIWYPPGVIPGIASLGYYPHSEKTTIPEIRAAPTPSRAQMEAACTILAINQNNGFGGASGDSSTASIPSGIVFQQQTQYRQPSTMNPSASNVNALMILSAPGWAIQASYNNCLSQ